MALHHIALGARDVSALASFYEEAFYLDEIKRHHDGHGLRSVWLDMDGVILMVERALAVQPPRAAVVPGPSLLAFVVDEELHQAQGKLLVALGASADGETEFTSYFRDPEGNRVAISHYRDLRIT